jgi:hypothetical protein
MWQHPPVVHQREALVLPREDPVRRHDVDGQLPPGTEARPPDPVVAEGGQREEIGRGPDVRRLPFQTGQRHSLDEHWSPVDVQQRRGPAYTTPQRRSRVYEIAQLTITSESQ